MPDVLDYEPHLALFVEDILEFHKALFFSAKQRLKPGGWFLMETHPGYIQELESLALSLGFVSAKRILDSSMKERFLFLKTESQFES